jgi:hypothetical protein
VLSFKDATVDVELLARIAKLFLQYSNRVVLLLLAKIVTFVVLNSVSVSVPDPDWF